MSGSLLHRAHPSAGPAPLLQGLTSTSHVASASSTLKGITPAGSSSPCTLYPSQGNVQLASGISQKRPFSLVANQLSDRIGIVVGEQKLLQCWHSQAALRPTPGTGRPRDLHVALGTKDRNLLLWSLTTIYQSSTLALWKPL